MSYSFYKIIHLTSLCGLFLALGALICLSFLERSKKEKPFRIALITHGISLIILLISGFGLLAKIGTSWPWPSWVFIKLAVWLLFGGSLAFFRKNKNMWKLSWVGSIFLGFVAIFFAHLKP